MTIHKFIDYYGVALPVMEDGTLPLGICLSMKVMLPDGKIGYQEFKSPDMHSIEALGMLETFCDTMRMQIMSRTRNNE